MARMPVKLFLCGDVMTGRGVDQILPHPGKPNLHEPYVRSALDYVELAERASGPLSRPVSFDYVWGDALAELERARPDARIVNLETAVTTSEDAWPGKGIHYRMHPANLPCLGAARIDCCALANNHAMDWGRGGLAETLDSLRRIAVRTAGAGRDAEEAAAPATVELAGGARVLVFACAATSSGVPAQWAAAKGRSGVNLIEALSPRASDAIAGRVRGEKRSGDVVVLSMHWGPNWGFDIAREERAFAHRVIDDAGVDVVHGHSSHHIKGIEIHNDRPILYGCGDFLTDYEGIGGHEAFRPDLSLMYFPVLDANTGGLLEFRAAPTQLRRFRVNRAPEEGIAWLSQALGRESGKLGSSVERRPDGTLALLWR
jgi:poly-gamma-glutamate capsule biosynthesis protein CapA/YwtB (metallophosphatase superfamily)